MILKTRRILREIEELRSPWDSESYLLKVCNIKSSIFSSFTLVLNHNNFTLLAQLNELSVYFIEHYDTFIGMINFANAISLLYM